MAKFGRSAKPLIRKPAMAAINTSLPRPASRRRRSRSPPARKIDVALRHHNPRGQLFCFTESVSSPEINNIPLANSVKQNYVHCHPAPFRGASAVVTTRGGLRWTSRCPDERHRSVRRRRVVLTPRRWCQVLAWRKLRKGDGGKKADHRGDHVISRKAIAQGMSDVLRCPVCSCAHFLPHCA
jgi:hypothetical protein